MNTITTDSNNKTKRIAWIDVAKFFGIYSIYVFHFGDASQNAYDFVYVYCVPIFFFLSGCTIHFEQELGFREFLRKKLKTILLPFAVFSLLDLIEDSLINAPELYEVDDILISIAKGAVRNHYFAPGLWFLTCLFVMEIAFYFIKKLKKPIWIMLVCIALYAVSVLLIKPNPAEQPHMLFNVDSACYYIIYYGIGYVAFEGIRRFFEIDTILKKILFYVVGMITFAYSFLLYENVDFLTALEKIPYMTLLISVIRSLIVIWFVLFVSKVTEHMRFFAKAGADTLYLCGSEFLVKNLLPYLLGVFGLSVNTYYPIQIYIYSFVVLCIAERFFVPLMRKMLRDILD